MARAIRPGRSPEDRSSGGLAVRMRRRAAVELGEVGVEVAAALARGLEHRPQAASASCEGRDLAVDAVARVLEERAPLGGVAGRPEALAIALAGGLVLEQLADLGQAEPGVVAQLLDEAQALQVGGVEEAVRAVGAGGRLEQPDLLVVADRPGRQAGLGRDLLDPEEGARVWSGSGYWRASR